MIRLMLIGITLVVGVNAAAATLHMAQKMNQARAAAMEGR